MEAHLGRINARINVYFYYVCSQSLKSSFSKFCMFIWYFTIYRWLILITSSNVYHTKTIHAFHCSNKESSCHNIWKLNNSKQCSQLAPKKIKTNSSTTTKTELNLITLQLATKSIFTLFRSYTQLQTNLTP